METVYLIHKEGIVIKQIPIIFKDREKGYSKIAKIELFRTLINVFKLKFLWINKAIPLILENLLL